MHATRPRLGGDARKSAAAVARLRMPASSCRCLCIGGRVCSTSVSQPSSTDAGTSTNGRPAQRHGHHAGAHPTCSSSADCVIDTKALVVPTTLRSPVPSWKGLRQIRMADSYGGRRRTLVTGPQRRIQCTRCPAPPVTAKHACQWVPGRRASRAGRVFTAAVGLGLILHPHAGLRGKQDDADADALAGKFKQFE